MWVAKLLISPVKKKDFLPKNDQIWPRTGIFGQFGPGHAGLFSALLVGRWWLWRAGCISQDTYLLYFYHFLQMVVFDNFFADCPSGQLYLNFSFSKFSKHFSLKEDNISATPCWS